MNPSIPNNDAGIKNSAKNINDDLHDAAGNVHDMAHRAGSKVRDFVNNTYDEVSHTKENLTKEIRTNPVQSSLIALGAGFLIGSLLRK